MAKSRLLVDCWKHHHCAYCGCQYRRRVTSTKVGKGATQEEADAHATEAAVKYLQRRVDVLPCPHCGNQQPEMVGSLRLTWHVLVLLASFIWVGPLLLEYYGLTPRWVAAILLILIAAMVAAVHLWIITRYPNNYALTNRMRAVHQLRQLMIWVDQGPDRKESEYETPDSIRPGKTFWRLMLAGALSCVLLLACDALRWSQNWPTNKTWHPEVIGPGDSAWMFLPTTIQSLKGHWIGNASAVMEDADAPGAFVEIPASTRTDQWGNTIQVDRNESNTTRHLWVRIHVPDDPKLAGKKVRVHMAVNAVFPVMDFNQREFRLQQQAAQHQEEILLAPAGAGTTFWLAWYAGAIVPFCVFLAMQVYCVGCAYHLKHSGESVVVPCNQPAPEAEEEPPLPKLKTDTPERDERFRDEGRK